MIFAVYNLAFDSFGMHFSTIFFLARAKKTIFKQLEASISKDIKFIAQSFGSDLVWVGCKHRIIRRIDQPHAYIKTRIEIITFTKLNGWKEINLWINLHTMQLYMVLYTSSRHVRRHATKSSWSKCLIACYFISDDWWIIVLTPNGVFILFLITVRHLTKTKKKKERRVFWNHLGNRYKIKIFFFLVIISHLIIILLSIYFYEFADICRQTRRLRVTARKSEFKILLLYTITWTFQNLLSKRKTASVSR